MSDIQIRKADNDDMVKIIDYLIEFRLDTENLEPQQFLLAEIDKNLAGFGRIKQYEEIYELSSVGVVPIYRKNGIGKLIVEKLIEHFPVDDVWITTKIPEFFSKFGFIETESPPEELKHKSERVCTSVHGSVKDSKFMIYKRCP